MGKSASVEGLWTVDEHAGKLPRQLQPEATVRAQQGLESQKHGGARIWIMADSLVFVSNARCSRGDGSSSDSTSFRIFAFTSTPKKDDNAEA
ncbi:hypothetical protein GGI43DRAFT_385991 [Trichoderma evansii]